MLFIVVISLLVYGAHTYSADQQNSAANYHVTRKLTGFTNPRLSAGTFLCPLPQSKNIALVGDTTITVVSPEDGTGCSLQLEKGWSLWPAQHRVSSFHDDCLVLHAFAPIPAHLMAVENSSAVFIVDTKSKRKIHSWRIGSRINSLAVADGDNDHDDQIAVAAKGIDYGEWRHNSEVQFFDRAGKLNKKWEAPLCAKTMKFLNARRLVLAGEECDRKNSVMLVDCNGGELLQKIPCNPWVLLEVIPDKTMVAMCAFIFDRRSPQLLTYFSYQEDLLSVAAQATVDISDQDASVLLCGGVLVEKSYKTLKVHDPFNMGPEKVIWVPSETYEPYVLGVERASDVEHRDIQVRLESVDLGSKQEEKDDEGER